MELVGKRIAERRKQLGLTQEELAERLGYKSKTSINKIETGKNIIPAAKVAQFAKALHTTPGYLMGWEEDAESKKINDAISDVVLRMHRDPEFREVVEILQGLDAAKIVGIRQLLNALI